ncbi:MAG: hypothetical protein WA140_01965 [Geobacteraceae bacterium]
MRCIKWITVLLVPLMLLSLAGCGSDSNGTTEASNPFSGSSTIFGNISTASGKTGITLTTNPITVDVDNGQVLATAKLVSGGVAVSGASVAFSIVSPTNGPATIDAGLTTVPTDSNGVAVTRITTGNVLTTTNVIVKATSTIGGQTATAYATFQIVRGGGVIMFTKRAGLTPGDQINQLDDVIKIVDPAITTAVTFLLQLPFKVTDSNGNPRVGVPVTLSIVSNIGAPVTLAVDQSPVTTDSAGQGIFNFSITMASPPAGSFTSASVIFQAATNDAIPVTAYVGGNFSIFTTTTP